MPIVGLVSMDPAETLYTVSRGIPNRKSALLIDEWFGVLYKDGASDECFPMDEAVRWIRLGSIDVPNTDAMDTAQQLLQDVVERAKTHVFEASTDYKGAWTPT